MRLFSALPDFRRASGPTTVQFKAGLRNRGWDSSIGRGENRGVPVPYAGSPGSGTILRLPYASWSSLRRQVLFLHPLVDPPDSAAQLAGDADLPPALVPQPCGPLGVERSLPGTDLAAACPCRPHPGLCPLTDN